jgi:hypothetical protein
MKTLKNILTENKTARLVAMGCWILSSVCFFIVAVEKYS